MLNRPELFAESETARRGKRLIKRGRRLHDKKLQTHLRGLLEETKAIVLNIQNDPATAKLQSDMKKLIQDVMLDEEGNIVLKVWYPIFLSLPTLFFFFFFCMAGEFTGLVVSFPLLVLPSICWTSTRTRRKGMKQRFIFLFF